MYCYLRRRWLQRLFSCPVPHPRECLLRSGVALPLLGAAVGVPLPRVVADGAPPRREVAGGPRRRVVVDAHRPAVAAAAVAVHPSVVAAVAGRQWAVVVAAVALVPHHDDAAALRLAGAATPHPHPAVTAPDRFLKNKMVCLRWPLTRVYLTPSLWLLSACFLFWLYHLVLSSLLYEGFLSKEITNY